MHKWADTQGIANQHKRKGCPGEGGSTAWVLLNCFSRENMCQSGDFKDVKAPLFFLSAF
jgi:hypothetical protein